MWSFSPSRIDVFKYSPRYAKITMLLQKTDTCAREILVIGHDVTCPPHRTGDARRRRSLRDDPGRRDHAGAIIHPPMQPEEDKMSRDRIGPPDQNPGKSHVVGEWPRPSGFPPEPEPATVAAGKICSKSRTLLRCANRSRVGQISQTTHAPNRARSKAIERAPARVIPFPARRQLDLPARCAVYIRSPPHRRSKGQPAQPPAAPARDDTHLASSSCPF
jgi:hypothetical protein